MDIKCLKKEIENATDILKEKTIEYNKALKKAENRLTYKINGQRTYKIKASDYFKDMLVLSKFADFKEKRIGIEHKDIDTIICMLEEYKKIYL